MKDDSLQHAVRVSGIRGDVLPSLEQIEKRRFELWLLSTVLLVGLTLSLAILSMWSPEDMHSLLVRPYVRYGVLALAIVLSAYSVEKEMNLRRLSRMLLDERLLTTALSNRLHEISTLLDAGRAVNSTLELDRVLSSILSGATDLMPASSGSVMLLDDNELVVAAAVGNSVALGRRVALGDGIAGHVARTMQPLLINGQASPAIFPGLAKRVTQVGSSLCVPLVERGELLGVLNLSAETTDCFSEYDLRAISLFAEQAAAAIGKARLYAQSQQQATALAHAASHDSLTGLANRSALEDAWTGTETLLFLDLDGFKAVNDELGHAAGDEVLIAVAQRLSGNVSGRDLVARFGGDEFAVLLRDVADPAIARSIAERVLMGIAQPLVVDGNAAQLTASIGLAMPAMASSSLAGLLRQADKALYTAKAGGKNRIEVYESPVSLPLGLAYQGPVPLPRQARGAEV
ncbi:MAG: sensor domain-containing diguanylate cyclase [Frankiaceae bacterium]|nr:sensor domain-containing diguanylate cyclase [Frankiaceae bacterium]